MSTKNQISQLKAAIVLQRLKETKLETKYSKSFKRAKSKCISQ